MLGLFVKILSNKNIAIPKIYSQNLLPMYALVPTVNNSRKYKHIIIMLFHDKLSK